MRQAILDRIESPDDIKQLSHSELTKLADELRHEMVEATSVHGGHLASSLGCVEIVLALHRVLDCPHDRIVFDVGHQAYAHKLLTGRRGAFKTLRCIDGISGFPKIDESPYDSHDAGHASDSLSTALGYALARDLDGDDSTIVALIGDASFTGGMALEALNEIGQSNTKLIIILNDNGMSISVNVGGFSNFLSRVRLSEGYQDARADFEEKLDQRGKLGAFVKHTSSVFRESVKRMAMPEGSTFFEGFGVTYVGPVDGHDIGIMERILKEAKDFDGPVLIHTVTTKGRGYIPAEKRPDLFHGVGPFDSKTGERLGKSSAASWTSVFSKELCAMARDDERIVAITAAMPDGTGLSRFGQEFPDRFFDVGIAEQNAVGMSSSLAMAGKVPFVAIYSTFIQRAFDQLMINVALQKQHVVFCLDRAGLVGEDGPTHHGGFDLSFMRCIPGMTILAPSSDQELRDALHTALELDGPVCIRYPRGAAVTEDERTPKVWEVGRARKVREGSSAAILAVGSMVTVAMEAARLLAVDAGIECEVWDARWVKPIDEQMLRAVSESPLVVTLEDNSICGGFGSGVLEGFAALGKAPQMLTLGLPDDFVQQGPVRELRARLGISPVGIAQTIQQALSHKAN